MKILDGLNERQREAVTNCEGPLLVLAGAGSGKTRALVSRAAWLLQEKGIFPGQLLAITFTNKAAREMQERLERLTGLAVANMWVGTFHGICLRILHREYKALSFDSGFVIYDDNDQQTLLKNIIKSKGLSDKEYAPRAISAEISKAKNMLLTPELYSEDISTEWENVASNIYFEYQRRLKAANAMDFDDLIMWTVKLFEQDKEILRKYQERFRYILVDEYQDTNYAQYQLIKLLAAGHHNVCAVGDPDQSIYSWRGADIGNILNFEKDYPEAGVIRLEQNYRSTGHILNAANGVIVHNQNRKPKELWTEAPDGEKVRYHELYDDRAEAMFIVNTIAELHGRDNRSYKDFAVIYRTHTQARVIEDAFIKYNLPYRIYGGLRFYERKEIKDTLAYLRVLVNPADDASLMRIINEPKRSIGNASVEKLQAYANEHFMCLYDTLTEDEAVGQLPAAARKGIAGFVALMEKLKAAMDEMPLGELMEELWIGINYREHLEKTEGPQAETKLENLRELKAAAVDFIASSAAAIESLIQLGAEEADIEDRKPTLSNFLAQVSLATDLDGYNEEDGAVTLLTMHATKGLEFPVVFMAGLEEKLFPHSRSYLDENEMEEERRLCYVAMTRAEELLFMSSAHRRNVFGSYTELPPSRFIGEVPLEHIEVHTLDLPKANERTEFGTTRRFEERRPMNLFTGRGGDTVKKPAAADKPLIGVGDKVQHGKFGVGIVVSVSGSGEDAKLSIAFAGQGVKEFIQKYAPIKKIK